MSLNLNVSDIKVFVPARDFSLSLDFYLQLGWKTIWKSDDLAELELGGYRFYLQDYYQKGWANNFMLYINVADAKAWHTHVLEVLKKGQFGKARTKNPALQPHGDLVVHVWDPSGVLLHFAQQMNP